MQLQRKEQDEHALWIAEKKTLESHDSDVARILDYDAKEQVWLEEYKREVSRERSKSPSKGEFASCARANRIAPPNRAKNSNWLAEVKGDKAMKRIQAEELKHLYSEHKQVRCITRQSLAITNLRPHNRCLPPCTHHSSAPHTARLSSTPSRLLGV